MYNIFARPSAGKKCMHIFLTVFAIFDVWKINPHLYPSGSPLN